MRCRLISVSLSLATLACTKTPPEGGTLDEPSQILLLGCSKLHRQLCEIEGGQPLTVWVTPAHAEVEVTADGLPQSAVRIRDQDGVGLRFVPAALPSTITVATAGAAYQWTVAPNSIRLDMGPPTEAQAAYAHASKLGRLARATMNSTTGSIAESSFRGAAYAYREAGYSNLAANEHLALAHTLIYSDRRIRDAAAEVESAALLGRDDPLVALRVRYYRGVLEFERSDFRRALFHFSEASRWARRSANGRMANMVAQMRAQSLQALGRFDEAETVLLGVLSRTSTNAHCARAEVLNNIGWLRINAASCGSCSRTTSADVYEPTREAITIYGSSCKRPLKQLNSTTNLAWWASIQGNHEEAADLLERAKQIATSRDARIRAVWLNIEGRRHTHEARFARALESFNELVSLAVRSVVPGARWYGEVGRARVFERQGRYELAIEAYARANRATEEDSLLVPIGEGRGTFLNRFNEGVDALVELLLSLGRERRAADVVRLNRARLARYLIGASQSQLHERSEQWDRTLSSYRRIVDQIHEREAKTWRMPSRLRDAELARLAEARSEALSLLEEAMFDSFTERRTSQALGHPLSEQELMLVVTRVRRKLLAFGLTPSSVRTVRLDVSVERLSDSIAAQILSSFSSEISNAKRLYVLPCAEAQSVDFHSIDYRGKPLVASIPVVYGADLPRFDAPPAAEALLIADPTGDLASARLEIREAAKSINARGVRTIELAGNVASVARVRSELERGRYSIAHFAGHSAFEGLDGWASYLQLSDGHLSIADVLSLSTVPPNIVLSSCEGGGTDGINGGIGYGAATAFLLAGAQHVVATTRPVSNEVATVISGHIHKHQPEDWANALATIQAELARKNAPGWREFRVFGR